LYILRLLTLRLQFVRKMSSPKQGNQVNSVNFGPSLLRETVCGYKIRASNLIEIATRGIFRENIFFIFEKLNNQCKVDIIFIKSFYLNGKTEFYEIILALLENFFYTFKIFFFLKIKL